MKAVHRIGTIVLILSAWLSIGCTTEVKIGAVVSETGTLEPYGRQVRRGLELALDEINGAGGFKGAPIQVFFRDDRSQTDTGRSVTEELIKEEGVTVVIGAVSSPVTLEIAKICEQNRVVLISPSASAPKISDAGEYVFRNYPSDVLEGTSMGDFARGLGLRAIAVIAVDNEWGAGLEEVFARRFESKSRKIVGTWSLKEGDVASIDTIVSEIAELKPEGIYLPTYVDDLSTVVTKLREAGVESVIMASSAVTDALIANAGASADRTVFPQPVFDLESKDEVVSGFVRAFRERYDMEPDIWAAHGYDALKLVYQAMVNTGHSFPDEVKRGLIGLEQFEGAAGRTTFNEQGDVVRYPRLFIISEGERVPYEDWEKAGGELTFASR